MEAKPIFASKTFWVNIVALIASIGTAFGFDLGLDAEAQTAIVGGALAVANVALRLTTSKPVRVGKGGSALALLLVLGLGACAVQTAETPSQKAYALYGSFVAIEEAAADLVESPETPIEVVRAIQKADAVAKPLADAMRVAALNYASLQTEIELIRSAGGDPPDRLLRSAEAALAALATAQAQASPAIASLRQVLNE